MCVWSARFSFFIEPLDTQVGEALSGTIPTIDGRHCPFVDLLPGLCLAQGFDCTYRSFVVLGSLPVERPTLLWLPPQEHESLREEIDPATLQVQCFGEQDRIERFPQLALGSWNAFSNPWSPGQSERCVWLQCVWLHKSTHKQEYAQKRSGNLRAHRHLTRFEVGDPAKGVEGTTGSRQPEASIRHGAPGCRVDGHRQAIGPLSRRPAHPAGRRKGERAGGFG